MIGRQVIETSQVLTLQELERFMHKHWDSTQYSSFVLGNPPRLLLRNTFCFRPQGGLW